MSQKQPDEAVTLNFRRITLGNLLSILTIIASVAVSYFNLKGDLLVVKNDIQWMKDEMRAIKASAPPKPAQVASVSSPAP